MGLLYSEIGLKKNKENFKRAYLKLSVQQSGDLFFRGEQVRSDEVNTTEVLASAVLGRDADSIAARSFAGQSTVGRILEDDTLLRLEAQPEAGSKINLRVRLSLLDLIRSLKNVELLPDFQPVNHALHSFPLRSGADG